MIDEKYIRLIEEQLNEKIEKVELITETKRSYIFHICGTCEYVLKQSKRVLLLKHFECHKRVFNLWQNQKEHLGFRIAEPYLLSPDNRAILMEYVEGDSLLKKMVSGQDNIDDLFRQTGRGLRQYHALMTQAIDDAREDLSQYEYMVEVLSKVGGDIIRERLNDFPTECKRVIFKDFTPSNVVVSNSHDLYFLDVQEAFYFAPFYYDLSRFIDTTKVFVIIKNPICIFSSYRRILNAIRAFLTGYEDKIDFELLRRMQYIHRIEHVHIKTSVTPISGFILKVLYKIV